MDDLKSVFQSRFSSVGSPETARAQAFARLCELGLPTRQNEAWKYTRLSFARNPALMPPAGSSISLEAIDFFSGPLVVFKNGRLDPQSSRWEGFQGVEMVSLKKQVDTEGLEAFGAGDHSEFTEALTQSFFEDGLILKIKKSWNNRFPIQVVHLGGKRLEPFESYASQIDIEDGAQAVLVENFIAESQLTRATTERIKVGARARLQYFRIIRGGSEGLELGATTIEQRQESSLVAMQLVLGGRLVRHELKVKLQESGAEAHLFGLNIGDGEQHVDNQTCVEHLAPQCLSRQLYKGILSGHSRSVFNGRIFIAKGAQGTDSDQKSKNLLLSAGAEVDAKPQLEVFADDVKATHGAAIGRLDLDQLFYMQSRGISPEEAVPMLGNAFLNDVILNIGNQDLAADIRRAYFDRLGQFNLGELANEH